MGKSSAEALTHFGYRLPRHRYAVQFGDVTGSEDEDNWVERFAALMYLEQRLFHMLKHG